MKALAALRDRAAELAKQGLAYARYYYQRYPARTVSYVVAALIFGATKLGIAVDKGSILQAVGYALPVLLGGEYVHTQVEPVATGVRKPRKLRTPQA